ncbi:MAG TPA: cytochrome c family protein [Xanthobacteraceae bacterium]|jgi:cytochrome c
MNSFELNKILGAVLGTCLGLVALNIAAGAVFTPEVPAKPGYDIPVPQKESAGASKDQPKEEQPQVDLPALLAKADVSRGQMDAQKCAVCHTFDKGGKPLVGPNLWGVVGRPRASQPGFTYSQAMKDKGGTWTVPDLFQFIANPKAFVPGTAMTFAGIPRASERADVVAYLNSLSDNPAPLSKAAEAAAPENATRQAGR